MADLPSRDLRKRLPLPGGEGRGEGERLFSLNSYGLEISTAFLLFWLASAAPAHSQTAPFSLAPLLASLAPDPAPPPKSARNVEGIMDNSFLIEEAYNQQPGVVQHIFNAVYGLNRLAGPDEHDLDFSFTQEWPLFSQTHQFSYTLPYHFSKTGSHSADGLGDVLLNYRFQSWFDEKTLTALAPRFSLILPTGDAERGFGDDTVGYQWSLPFSTTLGDFWFFHANAGLTFLPQAGPSPRHDLLNYNLGASLIYAVSPRVNFMLEWIGSWNESPEEGGATSRQFESVISPGIRCAFNSATGSQFVVGLATPIGLTASAPDIGVFLYLSFEHSFTKVKK